MCRKWESQPLHMGTHQKLARSIRWSHWPFWRKTKKVRIFAQMLWVEDFCNKILWLSCLLELTTEHTGDIALMLSSCNDIESAYIPRQLSAIANEIRSMNIAEAFGTVDPSQGVEWLETNCDRAHTLLLEFLTKHPHRAYKEVRGKKNILEPKLPFHYSSSSSPLRHGVWDPS